MSAPSKTPTIWLYDLLTFSRTRRHARRFRVITASLATGRDWDDLIYEIRPFERG